MHPPSERVTVSVVMTLYNKGPYVIEAIRSILDGSYTDLEVVVVDDASTDEGPELVQALDDHRVRFLPHAVNTGRAAAANRGFLAAQGSYIAILDADDISQPERLARQVAYLEAHPEVGVVGSAAQQVGAGSVLSRWPAEDEECRAKLLFGDPVLYGTCMFRRHLVTEHGARCDEAWRFPGMDYLFLLGVSRFTRYANLQEPLLLYRIGPQNMRHGRDPAQDRARTYGPVFAYFGLPADPEHIALQVMLHNQFLQPPTFGQVRRLRAWCDRLVQWNRSAREFPTEAFERIVEHRWQRLFHHLADRSFWAALSHLLIGPRSWASVQYLLRVSLRRWTGRR
jgi:glycosyltransferase involved in cell wall biosynthesis